MGVINASGVYKVFGRRAEQGVERLKAGETREDLRRDGLVAAVIDASFDVQSSEIFVVMGLSGSGKSTLIRAVNGLMEPTAGSIEVEGEDITKLSPKRLRAVRREKISMVFQHFALFPHRTVADNAAYGLAVRGAHRDERRSRAEEALEMVGLKGWGDSLPGQLSGGMRQRVGLARALAAGTDIMLMDEAFSALDPLIRREMQDQLIELQHQLDKTILFITHDLNEAMRLGDRIAMMRDGRIVQIGTSEEILNEPANDYVAKFIHDVDRTRVLTASTVMEAPVALLGTDQGPRTAHKLMRENQINSLIVVDRDKHPHGVVVYSQIADAVDRGEDDLRSVLNTDLLNVVPESQPVAELFAASASTDVPLVVVDEAQRLLGVIPQVTLLNALGRVESNAEWGEQTDPGDADDTTAEAVGQ